MRFASNQGNAAELCHFLETIAIKKGKFKSVGAKSSRFVQGQKGSELGH
jgi:hypothetical protein